MLFPQQGGLNITDSRFAGEGVGRGYFNEGIIICFLYYISSSDLSISATAVSALVKEEIRDIKPVRVHTPALRISYSGDYKPEILTGDYAGYAFAHRTETNKCNLHHAISSRGSIRSRDFWIDTRRRMASAASISFLLIALIVIRDVDRSCTAGMLIASSQTSAKPVESIWSTVSERSVCIRCPIRITVRLYKSRSSPIRWMCTPCSLSNATSRSSRPSGRSSTICTFKVSFSSSGSR